MRVLSGILFLILPIFSQAAPRSPPPTLEQLREDWLAKPGFFIFMKAKPTIYYHCFENSCRGSYGRLVKDTIVKVAVKKTTIGKFIIGYAQEQHGGGYRLVPFVEDAEYAGMGTQRIKMRITGNKAEQYETLDQQDEVNPLFYQAIETKYLFEARVVEYKDRSNVPRMIGANQSEETRRFYRQKYVETYYPQDK